MQWPEREHRSVGVSEKTVPSEISRGGLSPGRLIPVAVLAAGLVAFFALDLGHYLSFDALRAHRGQLMEWVDHSGLVAGLLYMGVYAVVIAFSLPGGAMMTITGGFLFGPLLGTGLTVLGATTGATILFLAARFAFAEYLHAKAGPALHKMETGFQENALSYLLTLRLIPLFPFWLVNLVPALLGVRLDVYLLGTVIGIIPGTVIYTMLGDGLGAILDKGEALDLWIILEPRFFASLAGLAVLALLPVLYKKIKARKARSSDPQASG
jgi:uncharacterized membrane protein YdjX (TVP38/TMEM64 family)